MRLAVSALTLWIDNRGRIATIVVPLQNFAVVNEEFSSCMPSFRAIIAESMKAKGFDYGAPAGASFTSEEVKVPAKNYSLAGTLLLPKGMQGPFPAVITITGSGQQTRDEFLPLPGLEKYRPFRQVAEALAAHGIAVLRVDDRGTGGSTGADTLSDATSADFADDTRAQISYLRSRPDIDPKRVALVGHSEGGVIAPMVAATDPQVAAIVLMAGTAKRGEDVILYQIGAGIDNDQTLTEEVKKQRHAEQREMIHNIETGGDTSKAPAELNNAWMKYFFTYDPMPAIRKVRQPVLILQGGLDRQVTPDQADMLEAAARQAGNKDVSKQVYPNLNHLFLPAKTGWGSEYSSLSTNAVPDEVISALTNWLVRELKAQ
jgi:dipeptidyl aminopeptidase/acylaminoacyl peptidase